MGTLTTIIGDIHAGSSFGVMPPSILGPDGQEIKANKYQRELWKILLQIKELTKNPSPLLGPVQIEKRVLIVGGDLTEGRHHRNMDVVSPRVDVHEDIAIQVIEQLASEVDKIVFIKGTPAHVEQGAQSEERVARNFDHSIPDPEYPGSRTWFHFRQEIDKVRIDIAHHISGTRKEWTRTTPVRSSVLQAALKYAAEGLPPPDLLLRFHIHKISDTGISYPTRGLTLPSLCWLSHFAHKIQPEELVADVGATFLYTEKGGHRLEVKTFPVKRRKTTWSRLEI